MNLPKPFECPHFRDTKFPLSDQKTMMKTPLKNTSIPILILVIGVAAVWFVKNAYSAGPTTSTAASLEELSAQIAAVKAEIATVKSSMSGSGIKQVIRGLKTGSTTTFSPAVVPSKCVVTLHSILMGGSAVAGYGDPAIVTALTENSISIQPINFGDYKTAYEIVEYY
jgi:H+/Cl- antiporter ClcA